jgi:hypothetical protein
MWCGSCTACRRLRFVPSMPADAAHPRALSLVVIDADSGRPLQALRLRC